VNYDWTGNIRELANVVERSVILSKSQQIDIACLPPDLRGEGEPKIPVGESFEDAITNFKKRIILKSLREAHNNKAEAARNLKMSRAYFFRLLNQLDLK
jgi:DNA-binding NtrC family response regulator